jgi:hypothetical protein
MDTYVYIYLSVRILVVHLTVGGHNHVVALTQWGFRIRANVCPEWVNRTAIRVKVPNPRVKLLNTMVSCLTIG